MLLILALLLWPLDIALRRVSVGRRELADARRWVAGGWRRRGRTAPRPVEVAGMLAARDRAAGTTARAAILRGDSAATPGTAPPPAGLSPASGASTAATGSRPQARPAPAAPSPSAAPPPPRPDRPAAGAPSSSTAAASPPSPPSPAPAADAADTLARLREAKRRARG
jgi:hypothetical protein